MLVRDHSFKIEISMIGFSRRVQISYEQDFQSFIRFDSFVCLLLLLLSLFSCSAFFLSWRWWWLWREGGAKELFFQW